MQNTLAETLLHKFNVFTQEAQLAAEQLSGTIPTLLHNLSHVDQDIEAALRLERTDNQRLALTAIEERLEELLNELMWNTEPDNVQFKSPVIECLEFISAYKKHLTYQSELQQDIPNPYITGIPLDDKQSIFVGRQEFSAKLEQLLVSPRCPPLLLYGQRRMGKTSLLYNLSRLLPSTIIPLFVDLQGPAGLAIDHVGFLYNLSRAMSLSAKLRCQLQLPPLTRQELQADPFACFDEWLTEIEQTWSDSIILLILDEFINLEDAFDSGRLNEQWVLSLLRHQIQHRPRLKILLAGSHAFEELQRWSSYLVNVHTLHISYLSESEARQLIEKPVNDFPLRYTPAACQRVLQLTHCHPALVQLLCAEIVELKNTQAAEQRRLAQIEEVEAAIPRCLEGVKFYFSDILHNQMDHGDRQILKFLALQGEGKIVKLTTLAHYARSKGQDLEALKTSIDHLLRRELIEIIEQGYRFQIELMRRWLLQ